MACRVQAALALRGKISPPWMSTQPVPVLCMQAAAARGLLMTLGGQYALVVGCEALSRLLDPLTAPPAFCSEMGPGLRCSSLLRTLSLCRQSGGTGLRGHPGRRALPYRLGPITMDGRAVFRFAVEALPRCLDEVLAQSGLSLGQVDWVVCHQANGRIIDHCVRALKADPEKFYKTWTVTGTPVRPASRWLSTSWRSRPPYPRPDCGLPGFGAGLTWGRNVVPI